MKSKRELYESIMHLISVEVKKALNEYNKYEDCDHRRGGNVKDIKCLQHVLEKEYGYRVHPILTTSINVPYDMILRRKDNIRRQVYIQQKKKDTTTGNIAIVVKKYG